MLSSQTIPLLAKIFFQTKYSVKADFLSTTTCQAIFPNKILSQVNTIIQSSENQVKINFTQLAKSNLHPTGSLQYLQSDLSIDWSDFQALLNYLQVPALMDQFTVQILNSLKTVHKFRLLKITWLKVTQVWFYSSIAAASFTPEFYAYCGCMLQHEFLQSFIHFTRVLSYYSCGFLSGLSSQILELKWIYL